MNMMFGRAIPAPSPWTPEREAILRQMWADGASTTAIANIIGDGMTKNAIIGKAHRLGLPRHVNTGNPLGINGHKQGARPKKPKAAFTARLVPGIAAPGAPVGVGLHISHLRTFIDQCRFPEGEPTADMLYCGFPVQHGSSYCSHHYQRCNVPYRSQA